MTGTALDIEAFLKKSETIPVIDVRSPAEFARAHIPGAVNMPLFTNEERSVIGTLYLKKGSEEAISKGLDFIRPRMAQYKELAWQIVPGGEALLHCWRGGMRSNSMAWLFNAIGIKAYTLKGGYKSYRRYIHEVFGTPIEKLVVIGGLTGSGKTAIIEELERKGQQVIHLERMAGHKGSVFGGIGMNPQPGTEHFENILFSHIHYLDRHKAVFVEDESLSIGRIFLPAPFFEQMRGATFIHIEIAKDRRIRNLVTDYAGENDDLLLEAVNRIQKRIGLSHAADVAKLIREKKYDLAVGKILVYYDKLYTRSMAQHNRKEIIKVVFNEEAISLQAEKIINLINQNGN
jgi:tRNA 2-selenouridine synthase